MREKTIIKGLGYSCIIIGAISMLIPFLWMICISLMTDSQIFSYPPEFMPSPIMWTNYTDVFNTIPLVRYFLNSVFVALITVLGQIVFATLSGYAFARFQIKCKDLIFFLVLITMMVPPQVNIVPLFFEMRELNWLNTYYALIVPGLFGGFGIFLMRQWFMSLPKEVEEAAKIDGANVFRIFIQIALPLATPVLVTLAIFTFIATWNSFMWPLITTSSEAMRTLPVGLAEFKGSFREITQWSQLMACSVISCFPVVGVFLLGKKYFINDLLMGSFK